MVKIKEAILVEGRYDKNTLSQIVEASILETSGFGIFKDKQQMALLRRIAETRGLIVFTDSDGAGFVIRNHIKSAIPGKYLKHAYSEVMSIGRTFEEAIQKGLRMIGQGMHGFVENKELKIADIDKALLLSS